MIGHIRTPPPPGPLKIVKNILKYSHVKNDKSKILKSNDKFPVGNTTLHYITPHYTTLHYIRLHYTTRVKIYLCLSNC